MAALSEPVKRFIVQALACYDTPSQAAAAVKEEFGLSITRMQASSYDPTKVMGKDLSKKWKDLFHATREKFLEDASEIPIAKQTFRLRALQRLYVKSESVNNSALAAQLLEQAAKEIGGAFTNRRELTGKGGAPIKTESAVTMTADDAYKSMLDGG